VLAASLGIDERTLFTSVFALGSFLAGLAGALTLPREPANLGMDLAVIADAFVVTVLGGLGSVPGAFIAAIIIGVTKALCIAAGTVDVGPIAIAFPRLTLVIEFVVMALVLLVRPSGLLGRPSVAPATTSVPVERALVRRPARGSALVAAALLVVALLLPAFGDQYLLVLATDILVAGLFAASLRLIVANGGMTSFGHAAYFGLGAYAVALAATHGIPFGVALVLGPLVAALAALAFAALCVRMSGIYFAMLTLAFAQILWSIAVQWDSVTGGSNGIIGVWPPEWLGARTRFYLFVLVVVALALAALSHIAFTPFGYALRGARDSALRAEAIGVDVRARRIKGLVIVGAFAGLAGALYAFSKGGVAPDALSIPRSVDVLVMMLLGGMNALFGPLLGAIAFTWLSDVLARYTDYWRAGVGIAILLIVSVFPLGIGGALENTRSRLRFRS
jgi:branched-chain amino acid transport system permease protein